MAKHDPFQCRLLGSALQRTGKVWSGEPNPALVEEVSSLPPGTALEAGCGEGADAIWLAGQGWQVTAADFSTQALDRAAEHTPADLAEHVTWQQADIRGWQPDERPLHDLVTASFSQSPNRYDVRSSQPSLPESPPTDIW